MDLLDSESDILEMCAAHMEFDQGRRGLPDRETPVRSV
jgi:hypothetical protein